MAGKRLACPGAELLGLFVSFSIFTYKNSKAVEQTQVVRMVGKGRMTNRRGKARSQILCPYKEELSVGKMEFAAAGDNDHYLTGDLRATVGGFMTGGTSGLVAFMVLSPVKIPEPVAFSGQGEERHTYIRECRALFWIWNLISKCNFAKWRVVGFHTCPCSLLTPWFSEFPGHPWAAVLHGMSLPSAGMFLLEYWKGFRAPDRMIVFLRNHQVTWFHVVSSQLRKGTISLPSSDLPLGPLGSTAMAGALS